MYLRDIRGLLSLEMDEWYKLESLASFTVFGCLQSIFSVSNMKALRSISVRSMCLKTYEFLRNAVLDELTLECALDRLSELPPMSRVTHLISLRNPLRTLDDVPVTVAKLTVRDSLLRAVP